MDVLHAGIAIVAAIVLIIWLKVDPVISLIISCLYLGLAAGIGLQTTAAVIAGGFGDIMVDVGLLIGFGVLIGSLLHATGTFTSLVQLIATRVGKRLPYALTGTMAVIFPSIYVDVQVVLAAPMARESSDYVDRRYGLPWLAGAMGIGIFAGYVFVVPGLAAMLIAGNVDVSFGTYVLYGAPIGLATAVITTWLFRRLLSLGFWNPETDLEESETVAETRPESAARDDVPVRTTGLPLLIRMLPIIVPLVLIAFGAFAELGDFSTTLIAFLGDANIALFIGLVIAYVLARITLGSDETDAAFTNGLHTMGEILLITGIGGSLGAVIEATTVGNTLADLFSADSGASVALSIVLAWFVAALLHFAIGSVSVGALTASGIIGPIVGSLGVDPVVIGLAIASGAMFALHVNSNFFWMFKALLGLSTSGALKTLTLATSLGAIVSLPLVFLAALVSGLT